MTVLIHGDGVAGLCCAHLLRTAGFRVVHRRPERPRLPVILLGESALSLLRDVFETPDLFRDLPRIQKRIVAWQPGTEPVSVEHSGVAVSEEFLLQQLAPSPEALTDPAEPSAPEWTIVTSRGAAQGAAEHHFGSRAATAIRVRLHATAEANACWIESLAAGWIFMIPVGDGHAWLLTVGGDPDALRGESRVIAKQIAAVEETSGRFPAYPRLTSPPFGPGWIACGAAAAAFDPICGDGTAYAVREAILASAVVRNAAAGGNLNDLLAHYEERLTGGFARHLMVCRDFYETGYGGAWWKQQVLDTDAGLTAFQALLRNRTRVRYRLEGFQLITVP